MRGLTLHIPEGNAPEHEAGGQCGGESGFPAGAAKEACRQGERSGFDQLSGEEAVEVIGVLTRALPDDTSLISLQMQGSKIRISGQTPNTADLMQKLSAYPGLRDVKAPTAATRPLGVNKESFSLELELTPEAFRASEPGRAASAAAIASAPAPKASSPWK